VLNDGISIVPLNLELCPIPTEKEEEEEDKIDESNEDPSQTVDDNTLIRWMVPQEDRVL